MSEENINKKHTKEEMEQLVSSSNELSNQMLSHFFELLGFDRDLFNHLYDLEIKIDYDTILYNKLAHYESFDFNNEDEEDSEELNFDEEDKYENNNGIVINGFYIDEYLTRLDNGAKKSEIMEEIARTIIHEKLHSNRDVLLKSEVNFSNVNYYLKYLKMTDNDKKTYEECNLLKNNIELNDELTILKIENYNNYSLVYIYDNDEKRFNVYKLNLKNIKFNNDTQKYFKDIINYIIANKINPIKKIFDFEYLFKQNNLDINNIYESNKKFTSINEVEAAKEIIAIKFGLEEALIESLTLIIYYHSDKDLLNIEDACDYIQNKTSSDLVKNGITIYKEYKEDFVKWFILSSYQDEYNSELNKIYGNDYINILKKFEEIFYSSELDEEDDNLDKPKIK